MRLILDLEPDVESRVREYAVAEGVSLEELLARTFPPRLSAPTGALERTAPRKAPRLQVLPREQAIRLNAPTIRRLAAELAGAENATLEEVAEADAEWQELKQSLNENRRATAERLIFPEATSQSINP